MAKHLLLFAATTGYQIRMFADAARRLGVDFTLATDRCHILDDPWGDHAIAVKFDQIAESLEASARAARRWRRGGRRPAGCARGGGGGDAGRAVPSAIAAARACHDKYARAQRIRGRRTARAAFFRAIWPRTPQSVAAARHYPCVLKPLGLSASRGVIRANDPAEFVAAFRAHRARWARTTCRWRATSRDASSRWKGWSRTGEFQPLAIFDKPDPLEGPYFEETIYVTPSRERRSGAGRRCSRPPREAVRALGLRHGPVHAELRYNERGRVDSGSRTRGPSADCARSALRIRRRRCRSKS